MTSYFNWNNEFRILKNGIKLRVETHIVGKNFSMKEWFRENALDDNNVFVKYIKSINSFESLILLIAIAPHIKPNFFESIIAEHLPSGGDFPEFGGVKGTNHRGFLPTGETVQFILAGTDIEERLKVHQYFSEEHFFYRKGILWLEPVREGEPIMSGRIIIDKEWLDKILLGKESTPRFGLDFPAHKITTEMYWEDAVLHPQTEKQLQNIKVWVKYSNQLFADDNLKRKIKKGYRVLFHGPSGTGKTMTAALLGKELGKDVYRIDLSQIVSKYIGETEKNLETVFKKAETKNWILFFDEADALFGKRTQVQSSHDRYANQEVSYLLQRIEDYPGLLILASNFKGNLDEAFIRRFHAIIHFPAPQQGERLLLWQKALPQMLKIHDNVNLTDIASKYELTGAAIINAVQTATLGCLAKGAKEIQQVDIIEAIRHELMKEEKII
ncbi:MAG: ATP-binding protein [Niabella sp.]